MNRARTSRACEICKIKQSRNKGLFMAKFPKNVKVCKEWVRNTGVEDLAYIPIEKLCKLKYLCERHFKPKHFTKHWRRLKKKAVPLLNLVHKPLSEEVMKDFPLHVFRQTRKDHHEDHSYYLQSAYKLLQSSTINSTSGEEAPCRPISEAMTPKHAQKEIQDILTSAEPDFKENWQPQKPPDLSSNYESSTEFENSYHISSQKQRLFDESDPYNSDNVTSKADITIPLCDPSRSPEQRLSIDESVPYHSNNMTSKADITIPLCDSISSPEQRVSFDNSVSYNTNNMTSQEDNIIILICDIKSSSEQRLSCDEFVPYNLNNVMTKADITIPLFDPRKNETLQWLNEIEQLAAKHNWTNDMKSYFMQSRLSGESKVWHASLQEYDKSWSQWKELLLEAFPQKIDFVELLRTMLSRRKLPTENLTEYYHSKIDMLNRLEIYGDKAVACIIDGLPPYMKPQARAGIYMNPSELYNKFLSKILFVY